MKGISPRLKKLVQEAPTSPGCYLWKDANNKVLYVGKAKNLRARLLQYVNLDDTRPQIPRLMEQAKSFDYVVVDTEHEALVLEINLIQNYHPPFNIDLTDDKSYPFIAITTEDDFPALKYTREKHNPNTLYFGPYTDAHAARLAIDIVRKVCPLCVATCAEWKKCKRKLGRIKDTQEALAEFAKDGRPCFDYHVGKGPGVCTGAIDAPTYAEHVELAKQFLTGKHKPLIALLKKREQEAARALDFEKAARYKRREEIIEALDGEQKVYLAHTSDVDVCGIWREAGHAAAFIFCVREGRVVRTCEFILHKGAEAAKEELTSSFLAQYYTQTNDIPKLIDVSHLPSDTGALEKMLREKSGHAIHIAAPTRGERAKLLASATLNARHALMRYDFKTGYKDKQINRALQELETALALEKPPLRIECFDISTLHGAHTVGSMVVFERGRPNKAQYRRFKIHEDFGEANDIASMREVFYRRYAPSRMQDARFGQKPDLIIVDGGRPQMHAAQQALAELDLDIAVVGLAKADEELFVTYQKAPVILPQGAQSLYLVKQIRDEAHRFAITYHRLLRSKAMTLSILDEIPGIGPKRKRALIKQFGSIKKLKQASKEEIEQVEGISPELAATIHTYLQAMQHI